MTTSAWVPLKAEHTKQLLDILHVSHMWENVPGVQFATTELLKADLHPTHRLHLCLAQQYGLSDWIEIPIWMLLTALLEPIPKRAKTLWTSNSIWSLQLPRNPLRRQKVLANLLNIYEFSCLYYLYMFYLFCLFVLIW